MNNYMKKFVGNVNGKTFDNEIEFNAAAKDAIRSNDGHLSISSYYSYDDGKSSRIEGEIKDNPSLEKRKNILDKKDYVLVDQKPRSVYGYEVPSALYDKLINADNKDEIRKNVDDLLSKIETGSRDVEKTIKNLEIELDSMQDEMYEKIDFLKDLKKRKLYYNEIKNILDKKTYSKDVKKDFDKFDFGGFDIIATESLGSILKKLGL